MRWTLLAAVIVLGGLSAGCAAHSGQVAAVTGRVPARLATLSHGSTTREAVLAEWGQPSRRFEGERILTYRLDARYGVAEVPGSGTWGEAFYSLVLVFDSRGILEQHRLLRVR